MKRTVSFLIALIVLIAAMGTVTAFADEVIPQPEWYVTYEANGTMGGNLGNHQQNAEDANYRVNEKIANMEPGDEETFYIRITNNYTSPVRWFMKNIASRMHPARTAPAMPPRIPLLSAPLLSGNVGAVA